MLIFEDRRIDPLEVASLGTDITLREYAASVGQVEAIKKDRRAVFGLLGLGSAMMAVAVSMASVFELSSVVPAIATSGGVILFGIHCLFSREFRVKGLRAAKLDREALEHEMLDGLTQHDEQRKIDHG